MTTDRPPATPRDPLGGSERERLERLAAMGTLVAGFAHEIRNPMASLKSLAESLDEELAEAGLRLPHVDRMLEVIDRVEALVKTTLLFGRPSAPQAGAHSAAVVLRHAEVALGPRTRRMGGALLLRCAPGLPDIWADARQLVQILVILLNNALDSTADPTRVGMEALVEPPSPDGDVAAVAFEVWDEGGGIPADLLERIFDPFFTTKASGTGLGLSIAQQLVRENGGRLEVASPSGGRTRFRVTLPARVREGGALR